MASERVIPVLVYDDIVAAHDFLVRTFGFQSDGVMHDGSGQAVHGQIRVGDQVIWLHRAAHDLNLTSPRAIPAASSGLVIHVPDVDAHFQHARESGARVEGEPQNMPYGQREYGASDLEGHRWWFATPLPG